MNVKWENGKKVAWQTVGLPANRCKAVAFSTGITCLDSSNEVEPRPKSGNHYYPFGMAFADTPLAEQGKQSYKYNGKELDQMNGLNQYDYSARYYDPAIARFTTMDPMAEKNYSVSPYAYCNNNPVKFVDPTGKEVWITMYGENGKVSDKILYTPGMEYKGKNEFFKNTTSLLNKMNSVEAGNTVLNTLSSSENKYYYTNIEAQKGSGASTVPIPGSTDVYFKMGENASLENTAHELFHGYQLEKGVGGQSITNEVEAYAYGYSVAYNYAMDHFSSAESQAFLNQSTNMGQNNFSGNLYNNSFKSLLTSNVNNYLANYIIAISTFKEGASANLHGIYNNYPIQRSNRNYGLLFSFLPLLK